FASDPDRPAQAMSFSLAPGAPASARIDPVSGLFTWTTMPGQHIGLYTFGVAVTDSGSPSLSQTTSFTVDVVDNSPATITRARLRIKHGLAITLSFSQPLDPATAGNPENYVLAPAKPTKPTKRAKKPPAPGRIPLIVSYDPSTDTVTLTARGG